MATTIRRRRVCDENACIQYGTGISTKSLDNPIIIMDETGDTSFKPPQKVREVLEKEMEEKVLMDSGA